PRLVLSCDSLNRYGPPGRPNVSPARPDRRGCSRDCAGVCFRERLSPRTVTTDGSSRAGDKRARMPFDAQLCDLVALKRAKHGNRLQTVRRHLDTGWELCELLSPNLVQEARARDE